MTQGVWWEKVTHEFYRKGRALQLEADTHNAREYKTMQWNWETQRSLEHTEVSEETSKRGYKAWSLS